MEHWLTLSTPIAGVQVQSLVRELRCHAVWSKKKKNTKLDIGTSKMVNERSLRLGF